MAINQTKKQKHWPVLHKPLASEPLCASTSSPPVGPSWGVTLMDNSRIIFLPWQHHHFWPSDRQEKAGDLTCRGLESTRLAPRSLLKLVIPSKLRPTFTFRSLFLLFASVKYRGVLSSQASKEVGKKPTSSLISASWAMATSYHNNEAIADKIVNYANTSMHCNFWFSELTTMKTTI